MFLKDWKEKKLTSLNELKCIGLDSNDSREVYKKGVECSFDSIISDSIVQFGISIWIADFIEKNKGDSLLRIDIVETSVEGGGHNILYDLVIFNSKNGYFKGLPLENKKVKISKLDYENYISIAENIPNMKCASANAGITDNLITITRINSDGIYVKSLCYYCFSDFLKIKSIYKTTRLFSM
ncbi:MAG: hypothetical protein ABI723_05105 [Bacteroidia bacterium]